MCTVLLAFRRVAGWPLLVANNRDELYSRRALPPRVYRFPVAGGVRYWLACRDLAGGGSWWGWNEAGLTVWLTNRWTGSENGVSECRSRGQLVLDLLRAGDPDAARARLLESCRRYRFNPFNLLVVSSQKAFQASNFPHPQLFWLAPGFHFLGNGLLQECPSLKARSARRLFAGLEAAGIPAGDPGRDLVLSRFLRALATPLPQDTIPPQGFNVRFADYGTCASLCLAVSGNPHRRPLFRYCDGNPLRKPYQDYGKLLNLF